MVSLWRTVGRQPLLLDFNLLSLLGPIRSQGYGEAPEGAAVSSKP